MKNFTLGERLRYAFDNTMSRGTAALLGWLGIASAVMVTGIAALVRLTGAAPMGEDGSPLGFAELAWMGLLRTLDTGTMGGDTGSPVFLSAMLAVTLGGVFTVSMLIGVLNNGLEDKLTELRRGRSRVVESGHTVILGWSEEIFTILAELAAANANRPRSCVVILGDKDKVEMEEAIQDRLGSTGRMRIVCRSGSPIDPVDLEIASLSTSRSIIVLSGASEEPDTDVIKTILAITNGPNRRPEPYHIVAEIRNPRSMEAARLVGRDEAELVLVGDLVSRVIAQTCRQSGLSGVYTELMHFGGDEIYFHPEPALVGKTFREALLAYEDSTVLGIRLRAGGTCLNPPMDTTLAEGDALIVVSEDDDTVRLSGLQDLRIQTDAIRPASGAEAAPERTLMLGWNWRAPSIINELDAYVPPGSEIVVMADDDEHEGEIARHCAQVKNQTVRYRTGDTTDRKTLEALEVAGFKHVIVLSYSDTLDVQRADAKTLITLLHLRDISDRSGIDFSIASEMLDLRNRALAEVTRADDFIVSDKLISLLLAQISENKELNAVFGDIFDPEGSEIYLKPASNYVALGSPVNFYTLVQTAAERGEVALGYRLAAHAGNAEKAHGVTVNPKKSADVAFSELDRIIVLAES